MTSAKILHTPYGTPYLTRPHVIPLAHTFTDIDRGGLIEFIDDLGMSGLGYMEGFYVMPMSEAVLKVAGQLCYMSFGDGRTTHDKLGTYLDNLKAAADGSIFHHSSATFLLYGVSRSFTHELVRHGIGTGYSQASQRYTGLDTLRFVERPEYQQFTSLHDSFEASIDRVVKEYTSRMEALYTEWWPVRELGPVPSREQVRSRRKAVQGAARGCLPNETEAPIVVTANFRAWRHIIEMRTNSLAEMEIRILGDTVFPYLLEIAPHVFSDYLAHDLTDHTTQYTTKWNKI